jgi:hypothetical protein
LFQKWHLWQRHLPSFLFIRVIRVIRGLSLRALEGYGVFMIDVNPGNISFAG